MLEMAPSVENSEEWCEGDEHGDGENEHECVKKDVCQEKNQMMMKQSDAGGCGPGEARRDLLHSARN